MLCPGAKSFVAAAVRLPRSNGVSTTHVMHLPSVPRRQGLTSSSSSSCLASWSTASPARAPLTGFRRFTSRLLLWPSRDLARSGQLPVGNEMRAKSVASARRAEIWPALPSTCLATGGASDIHLPSHSHGFMKHPADRLLLLLQDTRRRTWPGGGRAGPAAALLHRRFQAAPGHRWLQGAGDMDG